MSGLFSTKTPEACGVPSGAVIAMLDHLKRSEVNIHGLCLMRGDAIFAEGYWKPFHKKSLHRMYSITKSFVSVAIGLLQEEGRLTLDDPICAHFPEKLSGPPHPFLAETTIRHMLCMTSPHWSTTYKISESNDWVRTFFEVEPTHRPGTAFSYDTSASLVLAALVEKLSGKALLDYLREKVLDKLDFSQEAYILPDPAGISHGGSGLVCTLEDIYTFAYVCMNNGRLGDSQLLPETYLKEATSKQIDTSFLAPINEKQGYGYQFWRSRHGGFTLYGMGGQLAVCFPKQKLIFATMADTIPNPADMQTMYDAFWTHIFPFVEHSSGTCEPLPEEPALYAQLAERLEELEITPGVRGSKTSPLEKAVQDKKYVLDENPMGLEYFILHFEDERFTLCYRNKSGEYQIPFSMNGQESFRVPGVVQDCLSFAAWTSPHVLTLQVSLIGQDFATARAQLAFKENTVTVHMKRNAEGLLENYNGNATGQAE